MQNKTDKNLLLRGLRLLLICLVLLFLGPVLLYISFSNQDKPLYIPLLIFGGFICIAAILLLIKGINTIMDSLFNKK